MEKTKEGGRDVCVCVWGVITVLDREVREGSFSRDLKEVRE